MIVGGVARPLRAQTWYYPAASDPATIEQSNYDRVFQLSRAFAYWAARGFSGTWLVHVHKRLFYFGE